MKIVKFVKYQLKVFFRGAGFIMPFIVTAVFLYMIYSQKPIDVTSGFIITGVFLFYIMAWIGISIAQQENEEVEQVLILKMKTYLSYVIGKFLFLVVLALIFTFLSVLFPIIQNIINNGDLFERPLVLSDIVSPLLILSSSSICGVCLGNLFHPRIIKNRKLAYSELSLVGVLVIANDALVQNWSFLKLILWVLPNITLPSKVFADAQYFSVVKSFMIFGVLILYALLLEVANSYLCYKNKF